MHTIPRKLTKDQSTAPAKKVDPIGLIDLCEDADLDMELKPLGGKKGEQKRHMINHWPVRGLGVFPARHTAWGNAWSAMQYRVALQALPQIERHPANARQRSGQ